MAFIFRVAIVGYVGGEACLRHHGLNAVHPLKIPILRNIECWTCCGHMAKSLALCRDSSRSFGTFHLTPGSVTKAYHQNTLVMSITD